jgi:hypothetical protein
MVKFLAMELLPIPFRKETSFGDLAQHFDLKQRCVLGSWGKKGKWWHLGYSIVLDLSPVFMCVFG